MTTSERDQIPMIQSIIARVTHEIDRKAWSALRSLYADHVDTDYTSLFGGTPQRQRGDELIAGWRKVLSAVSTQHLLGPIDVAVSDATASAECHVRAWHQAQGCAGGDEWVVGGHYRFRLEQASGVWKITAMTLQLLQQKGNTSLLQEAAAMDPQREDR